MSLASRRASNSACASSYEGFKILKTRAKIFKTRAKIFKTSAKIFKTLAKIFKTPAKIFKTRAKIFKTPAKIFKTLAKILDCSPQCSIPEPIRLGSKTIVFLVNVYVTSEAAINLSMGQRGNRRFMFLCLFPGQRST